MVIGAPLLGLELERGTWRLAWSQTVPRTRWLAANQSSAPADPEPAGPWYLRRAVRQPVSPEYLGLVTGWVARRWAPV